jgi:hypothetical protein
MIRETYKGRKLTARSEKSRGIVVVTCGGEPVDWPATRDLQAALDSMKPTIDLVDQDPSVDGNRWGAYLYAPGTYEMCPEGIHPQDIGGQCRHFTCEAKRKAAGS